MSKMIAYCGLTCSNCPTFIATQNNDDVAREQTVALYAQKFGLVLQREEINCDGCLSEGGRKIGYCQVCEIRKCCHGKGLTNCAFCEPSCEKLVRFHQFSPEAKACLETLKKQM
jgi:hypothetical protein